MTLPSGRVVSFGLMCSAAALLTGWHHLRLWTSPARKGKVALGGLAATSALQRPGAIRAEAGSG